MNRRWVIGREWAWRRGFRGRAFVGVESFKTIDRGFGRDERDFVRVLS